MFFSGFVLIIIVFFFQKNQGRAKKCYVYLERLPEQVFKKSYVKVGNVFENKVSRSFISLFLKFSLMLIYIY